MIASLFGEEASLDGVILRFLEVPDVIKDTRCTSGVFDGEAMSEMLNELGDRWVGTKAVAMIIKTGGEQGGEEQGEEGEDGMP
jgi:hypothetical protein